MSKSKSTGDNVEGLLLALRRGHSPKGPITTEPMDVELSRILRGAPVQFREGLNQDTLAALRDVLGVGREPDEDEQVDLYRDGNLFRTPPVVLVEATLPAGAVSQGRDVRAAGERGEGDQLVYVPADGWHRIAVHLERWEQRMALADWAGIPHAELDPPRIRAIVVHGTKDPVSVAKELNIRLNIRPQTPVSESERQRALFTLSDLHPDWGPRRLEEALGMSHVNIMRLQKQHKVRVALQAHGVREPSNTIMEVLYDADEHAWPDLAKVINKEKWGPTDLKAAIKRAKGISAATWSHLRDADGSESSAFVSWKFLEESLRVRLAYHYSVRQGLPDEQVVLAAPWLQELQGLAAGACGYHFSLAAFIRDAYLAHPPRGLPRARQGGA